MTETVNDSDTFTVGLTTVCPTPELAFEVTDVTNLKVTVNITKCNPGAGHNWKPYSLNLAGEDDNAIDDPGVGVHVYTFHSAGTKTLTLIGENDCGKATSASHTVTVRDAPVCPNVTASVTLVSKNNLTVTVDVQTTPDKGWMTDDPNIDWGDGEGIRPVSNGHHTHTYPSAGRYNIQMGGGLICGHASSDYIYVDVTAPIPAAHGQLEGFTFPASVAHGANIRVGFNIHNVGGQTGTFIGRLYQGSTKVGIDWRAVVHTGDAPSGAITVKSPSSGTSVTYTLKLFLET